MIITLDRTIQLILSIVLIIGIYQFYFWCQRNPVGVSRQLRLPVDDWIPYSPRWVWIYSCLYYPVIVYINFVIETPRQFLYIATSFLMLLVFQMAFFVFFPACVNCFL